jgi:hypothetical protein
MLSPSLARAQLFPLLFRSLNSFYQSETLLVHNQSRDDLINFLILTKFKGTSF